MALLKTVSLVTMLSPREVDTAPAAASVKNCSGIRATGFLGSVISDSSNPSGSLDRLPSSSPSPKWFWESAPTVERFMRYLWRAEKTIGLYTHAKRAPPNETLYSIVSPHCQLGLDKLQFGSLLLYDNIIRDAVDEDSKELGRETGLVGKTSDASSFYMILHESCVHFDYGTLEEKSVSSGRFDPSTTSELVITV